MRWFEDVARRQIDAAALRGELRGLAGEGKPLDRARLRETVDETLHRIMAEQGFVPPEFSLQKEIDAKRAVLAQIEDPEERRKIQRELAMIELKRAIAMDARRASMRG